ncbi:unnamed protein product [Linum trigynum]|uniref:Uncharacterized protein n=1 Tax=Linum trigynum TaxID=586398 RepID=A0AAV2E322_9ROSI
MEPKHGQTQGITRPCTAGRAFYAESKFGLAISVANTGTEARPCSTEAWPCPTRSTAVFPAAAGRVIKPWPRHGRSQAKHGRALDRALATDAFKQIFSHNSRGFEFLRERTTSRERK